MALTFFADQCVPRSIIDLLKKSDSNVLILRDYIPKTSRDEDVIKKAQELDAVLLTLNGDFTDIVSYSPEKYKGIVALQLKNHPEIIPQLMERLNQYIKKYPDMDHYKGKLLLVEVHRIRVKE